MRQNYKASSENDVHMNNYQELCFKNIGDDEK